MTKSQKDSSKIIFSSDFGKSSKGRLDILKGKIINAKYEYSTCGDCYFSLIYEDGRKLEILANDLGFQITKC